MTTDRHDKAEGADGEPDLASLLEQRTSAVRSLEVATKAFKKCRQRGGAAAYKRSWYYEEQMQKWQATLEQLDLQIQERRTAEEA